MQQFCFSLRYHSPTLLLLETEYYFQDEYADAGQSETPAAWQKARDTTCTHPAEA